MVLLMEPPPASRISSAPAPDARRRARTPMGASASARGMSTGAPNTIGIPSGFQDSLTHVLHRRTSRHGASTQENPAPSRDTFKLAGLFEVHQRAVDLPWFHSAVFQQQNRNRAYPVPTEFQWWFPAVSCNPRASVPSPCRTPAFSPCSEIPTTLRGLDRFEEARLVVPFGHIGLQPRGLAAPSGRN